MKDEDKTREQLLREVKALRAQVEAERTPVDGNQRRDVEVALEEGRRRFRAVFENTLDSILLMNDAGQYVDVNPAGCQLLGYTREELLGMTVWDVTPVADRARIPELLAYFLSIDQLSGEYTLLCKGGVERQVEFRSVTNILPGVHLAAQRDITQRKAAEEELRRQNEVLQTIFDHIPVMIVFLGQDRRVRLVNREFERVLGWSVHEALERDLLPDMYPDLVERERVAAYISSPPHDWIDCRTRTKNGRTIDTSWANVLLSDGTSIAIGQDVSERRQAEQALGRYAARLQALSQRLVEVQEEERRHIARELHDEIGQLLTSLKFAIEASPPAVPEVGPDRLGQARALIADLLHRVRELASDLRPALLDHLGLLPALRSLFERYTASTGVGVSFNQAGLEQRFSPRLETVAYRIIQEALTNVARHAQVTEVAVRVWVDADRLEVQVEDEGIGFEAEAALGGSGSSGLLGMQERVLLLGGRLSVESVPGGGTHLIADLPLNGHEGGGNEDLDRPGG